MNEKTSEKDNTTAHTSTAYDSDVRKTIPYYEAFHQETINLVKSMEMEPGLWLDTGCGTGTFVEKAAMEFRKTRFILADPSSSMLEIAKNKLLHLPRNLITFLDPIGTDSLIPAPSGLPMDRIDVITAIQSHHYYSTEKRKSAIGVCWELLRTGGVFITFENIRPFTEAGLKTGRDYWKSFQVSKGKSVEEANKHLSRLDKEFFPITVPEHMEILTKAGFKTVEILWYSYMQAGFYAIK